MQQLSEIDALKTQIEELTQAVENLKLINTYLNPRDITAYPDVNNSPRFMVVTTATKQVGKLPNWFHGIYLSRGRDAIIMGSAIGTPNFICVTCNSGTWQQ